MSASINKQRALAPLLLETVQGELSFPRALLASDLRVLNFCAPKPTYFPYGYVLDACGAEHARQLALLEKVEQIEDMGFRTLRVEHKLSDAICSAVAGLWALHTRYGDMMLSESDSNDCPFDVCLMPAALLAALKQDSYFGSLMESLPFRSMAICDEVHQIADDEFFYL